MSLKKKLVANKQKQESNFETNSLSDGDICEIVDLIFHCAKTGNIVVFNQILEQNPGISTLLDKPAKVGGRYPLHCACIEGQAGFAVELLEKGVNVNSANENGYTALHFSAMWSQLDCLKVLLNKGADVNLKTLNEETAYDVAKRYKKWIICDELEKTQT